MYLIKIYWSIILNELYNLYFKFLELRELFYHLKVSSKNKFENHWYKLLFEYTILLTFTCDVVHIYNNTMLTFVDAVSFDVIYYFVICFAFWTIIRYVKAFNDYIVILYDILNISWYICKTHVVFLYCCLYAVMLIILNKKVLC